MLDRVPLYPGRVQLNPVAGQTNVYDMTMADQPQQQGTPLNKASLLKDATAEKFGLGASAVPDDVLAWIGKYAEHWWKRAPVTYTENRTDIATNIFLQEGTSHTIQCASSINISNTGTISLVNPVTLTINKDASSVISRKPCYITGTTRNPNDVFYIPANADGGGSQARTIYYTSSSTDVYLSRSATVKAQIVTATETTGEWEYVFSPNRSAYPDDGNQDGYKYRYIGVPFEKFPAITQIESGSYIGTGTNGSSGSVSVTFGFVPEVVFITRKDDPGQSFRAILVHGCTSATTASYYSSYINSVTWNDSSKSISWYSTDSASMMNTKNATYLYVAIG